MKALFIIFLLLNPLFSIAQGKPGAEAILKKVIIKKRLFLGKSFFNAQGKLAYFNVIIIPNEFESKCMSKDVKQCNRLVHCLRHAVDWSCKEAGIKRPETAYQSEDAVYRFSKVMISSTDKPRLFKQMVEKFNFDKKELQYENSIQANIEVTHWSNGLNIKIVSLISQ